jgi:ATP-binding cassette subfamily F protein uup
LADPASGAEKPAVRQAGSPASASNRSGQQKKLSYRDQRELEALPARIEALEAEQRALGETIADPEFYKQPAAAINEALERAGAIERDLVALYARWDTLDNIRRT